VQAVESSQGSTVSYKLLNVKEHAAVAGRRAAGDVKQGMAAEHLASNPELRVLSLPKCNRTDVMSHHMTLTIHYSFSSIFNQKVLLKLGSY
jgi:hypothetical protein